MLTKPRTEETAICDLLDRITTAFNSQDVDTLLALHTDDMILMDPGMPTLHGKEEFRAKFCHLVAQGISLKLRFVTEELEISGDRAFARGYVFATKTKPGELPVYHTGRFIFLFRKQKPGDWLRSHVMVNRETVDTSIV